MKLITIEEHFISPTVNQAYTQVKTQKTPELPRLVPHA